MTWLAAQGLEFAPLFTGLVGGLALFLFGMERMATALKAVAGDRMRDILARLTTNRFAGVATGALATAVIQSSSVTTVLVVGFVTAGLLSLSQAVGVIMGANIGTTITAQVIAFKVAEWALPIIAAGFLLEFVSRRHAPKHWGAGLLGLGLVFYGMNVMGEAMAPLRSYPPFLDGMTTLATPLYGVLAGAAFTALVQSSSATTGIVIVMAGEGLIGLPAGIALILGANVGTCATALLAAIGKPREAVRAAVVHVLFNVAGVALWIGFVEQLAAIVLWMSPADPALTGTERLAAETPRQIANAHTVFNVVNTVLFVGFAPLFARAAERLAPDRPLGDESDVRPRYLDPELLVTPSLALDRTRLEILRLGEEVEAMLRHAVPAVLAGPVDSVQQIEAQDDRADVLHGQIITYLGQISRQPLTELQTEEFRRLMEAANDLESIGDVVSRDMTDLARKRIARNVRVSPQTQEVLRGYAAEAQRALSMAIQAVSQKNEAAAQLVRDMKPAMHEAAAAARRHESMRLVADEPNRLAAYRLETDVLESLSRVFYFARRIARSVLR